MDFYKENIPKYTGENFPPQNISEFSDKANLFVNVGKNPNVRSVDNYLRKFENLDLCFDLNTNKLIVCEYDRIYFTSKTYHKVDSFVKLDVLRLFNFKSISSIKNIHEFYCWIGVEYLIRYVSGIITVEEFASEIIKEIKSRLDKIKQEIIDKMLGIEIPRFDLYPVSLYSEEELEDFFIKRKENFRYFIESGFFDRVLSGYDEQNYFYDFLKSKLKVKNLSDELLLEAVSVEENPIFIEGFETVIL